MRLNWKICLMACMAIMLSGIPGLVADEAKVLQAYQQLVNSPLYPKDATLEDTLFKEYPAAEIQQDNLDLKEWITPFLDYFNGTPLNFDLPLDLQATAFQWKVWKEIQAIPAGNTSTYSRLASALGKPKAARAVARACATNPVSLVIPCHRVIREDGNLGGYRGGIKRKQALLRHEKTVTRKKIDQS